jgi:hypothetical protein
VTIGGAGSNVTLSQDATNDSLTMTSGATLAAGGTDITVGAGVTIGSGASMTADNLNVGGAFADNGSVTISAGTLDLLSASTVGASASLILSGGTITGPGALSAAAGSTLSGTGTVADTFTGAGTVTATGGSLAFDGTGDSFSGALNGAGTLAFTGGSDTLNTGATVTVATWNISNAGTSVTVSENLSYAGTFSTGSGTHVTVNSGDTLTLTGAATLAGSVNGPGTLAFAGGTQAINTGAQINSAAWSLSGTAATTLNESLSFAGAFTEGAGTSVAVASGNTFTLTGTSTLTGAITGAGTLAFAGGTATIKSGAALPVANLSISGSGTAVKLNEDLSYGGIFTDGAGSTLTIGATNTLTLIGTSTLSGSIKGGTLVLGGGTVALDAVPLNSALTLAGANVTLGVTGTYAGTFTESTGTLNLNNDKLTLTGAATFSGGTVLGPGNVSLKGSSTLDSFTIDGGAQLLNFAVASENGTITLGDGSGGSGKIMNEAGGTFDFTGDGSVVAATGGSGAFSNLASTSILEKTGGTGTSLVGVNVANSGNILVSSGTLEIGGKVTGATGTLTIQGAATLQFDKAVASGEALSFSGTGGDLVLGQAANFAGTIAGFAAGDEIDALHFGVGTTVSFVENGGNTGGTLTITNGTSQAQLSLLGQYAAAGFGSTSTNKGTVITYTPPAAAADPIAGLAPSHT